MVFFCTAGGRRASEELTGAENAQKAKLAKYLLSVQASPFEVSRLLVPSFPFGGMPFVVLGFAPAI